MKKFIFGALAFAVILGLIGLIFLNSSEVKKLEEQIQSLQQKQVESAQDLQILIEERERLFESQIQGLNNENESLRQDIEDALSALDGEIASQMDKINEIKSDIEVLSIFSDGQYDPVFMPQAGAIEEIQKSVLILSFEASIYKENSNGTRSTRDREWQGRGMAIGPRKILLPAHVYNAILEGWTRTSITVHFGEYELELNCQDIEGDVVILDTPPELVFTSYVSMDTWGDSSIIKDGDAVIIFGFPWTETGLIRPGIVASKESTDSKALENYVSNSVPALTMSDIFLMSINTMNGDSGSPIFAVLDREIKFIGMQVASLSSGSNSFGLAIKSNALAETIQNCSV